MSARPATGMGLPARLVLSLVRLHQRLLSPVLAQLLGQGCRYQPSCSEYARMAIERDGLGRGGARALRRLLRCSPLHAGGLDLP